jgi:hypothetical protein
VHGRFSRQPGWRTANHGHSVTAVLKSFRSVGNEEMFKVASLRVCQKLANHAHISYDYFARTSDKKHKDAVQYAWVGYGLSDSKRERILRD